VSKYVKVFMHDAQKQQSQCAAALLKQRFQVSFKKWETDAVLVSK